MSPRIVASDATSNEEGVSFWPCLYKLQTRWIHKSDPSRQVTRENERALVHVCTAVWQWLVN